MSQLKNKYHLEVIPTYKDNELYILFESNSSHYPLAFPKMKKVIKKSTN